MDKKVTGQVLRTKLINVFRQLKAGAFPKSKLRLARCEITIIDNQIIFNTPWAQFSLEANTTGTAKATFPLIDVSNVLNTFKQKKIVICVMEGKVQFESFSICTNTCFFEDDKILRSIKLPVNNNEADLINLLDGKYTKEELEFNKLWSQAVSAENRLNDTIRLTHQKLKMYGIEYEELEKFVKGKLA